MADIHPPPPPAPPPTSGDPTNETLTLPTSTTAATAAGAKRHRRPSVRLGDIGEQPAALPVSDPFLRRPKHHKFSSSSSRTRNLALAEPPNDSKEDNLQTLAEPPNDSKEDNLQTLAASIRKGNRDSKSRRGRTVRSIWTSNPDAGDDVALRSEFDDLRREDSLSPAGRDRVKPRVSDGDAPSATNGGDWYDDHNDRYRSEEDAEGGIRPWLNRLGLGRYAPVFEIHEVDDEVLPMLTLEDLKDMGINAVGSRRKMFSAIQKLNKDFT